MNFLARIARALEHIAHELQVGNRLKEKLMAKIDDITASLTKAIDALGQSIVDEIARVEALLAGGGLTPEQEAALTAQIDRLTAAKAELDAERPTPTP